MALANITSFATLKTAIAEMARRASQTDYTGSAETFIQLCEGDLNDEMLLKDMESEESLTLTASQNYVALPTGFVSPIALWLIVSSERELLTPVLPQQLPYISSNGKPEKYAIDAANVRFDCPVHSDYTAAKLRCIKKSNLSDSNTTNALLLKRPDVYLYGSLVQLAMYAQDEKHLQIWSAYYEKAKRSLKTADARNRRNVPMRTELASRGAYNINTDS